MLIEAPGARPRRHICLVHRSRCPFASVSTAGPRDFAWSTSLNNLASLLQEQGDLAAARPLFERALAICEKALGPEHPDTAMSLNNLAMLLNDHGDLAAARLLLERALAIYEKALGPEHPNTAIIQRYLANLPVRTG